MPPYLLSIAKFYDYLHFTWEKPATERRIGSILLWTYLIALGLVELKRQGFYPAFLPQPPDSHYYSVQLAFTLILGLEVIGLIFIIPSSLAKSMGKQMEILTLILLRNAFKELSILPEPVTLDLSNIITVYHIAVSISGGLCVFACLGCYRKIQRSQSLLQDPRLLEQFILSKKLLSFFLMLIFIGIGIYDIYLFFSDIHSEFFETIYTVLIFADIAMVLIAQRYMPGYYAVFRNSALVMGTLLMRLSLSAPPLLSAGIAVFSGLYIVAVTWVTNYFSQDPATRPPLPGDDNPFSP